jgi:hypothetical protein
MPKVALKSKSDSTELADCEAVLLSQGHNAVPLQHAKVVIQVRYMCEADILPKKVASQFEPKSPEYLVQNVVNWWFESSRSK